MYKRQLVAYLNTINLAQSNYGVKAAAEDYFGKELSELSLRECAMLAGCAQAPYTYDCLLYTSVPWLGNFIGRLRQWSD